MHSAESPSSGNPSGTAGLSGVAVVIVSYRSAVHLPDALAGLPRGDLANVVVVDNASDDNSVEVARSIPGVQVIASERNLGFGAGCNMGAAASPANATMLLFLNPDARIDAASLEALVDHLQANPRCALVAPRMFRDLASAEPLRSAGRSANVSTELRRFAPLFIARWLPERRFAASYAVTGPVDYVEGACMLVDRARYEAAGCFDEDFFLFFEELDLANRLRAAGWTVDLAADAAAQHEVGASRDLTPDGARPELVESTVRYLVKWRGRRRAKWFVALARGLWQLRVSRGQLSRADRTSYVRAANRALAAGRQP